MVNTIGSGVERIAAAILAGNSLSIGNLCRKMLTWMTKLHLLKAGVLFAPPLIHFQGGKIPL
jgi:hypothetical protein